MKRVFLFCLIVLLAFPLWSEYFYQNDHEVLTLIHISRSMGRVIPFSSFPVHGSDLLDFADYLLSNPASSSLSSTDFEMLEELISKLEKLAEGEILIRGGLSAAYEHRLSSGAFMVGEKELPNSIDVHRAFLNFSPVLSFYAEGGHFNGIWIGGQIDIRQSWENNYNPWSNFFTHPNIVFDFVKRGILAWNGSYFNASISRDTVHWGNPVGSTLYPSSLLPHMDSIRLNVPLGPFSFDYMLATIMPKRSQFRDLDDVLPLGDFFGFMKDEPDVNPTTILFAAHRFQWNFGKVKAGIGSTVVYARANNQFLLTDILPVAMYHNADSSPNNLALILDAQWVIVPGLSLYGMFGLDDLDAKIFGIPDGPTPTIPGVIFQIEYSLGSDNLFQSYIFEAGYTHYLWGSYEYTDRPDVWNGVRLARAIYRYTPNRHAVLLPLTSPYGPGTMWGKFKADYNLTQHNIRAGVELLFLQKNSMANLIDTPYSENKELDKFDQWFLSLDIPISYTWRSFEFLLSPAILLAEGKSAFECTIGVKWSINGSRWFSNYRR